MSYSSLSLDSDFTIRNGDAVCTDGDFDIQEEKYRNVLNTCAPIGLRALRDRRLIALNQSSTIAAASSSSSGKPGGGLGQTSIDNWTSAMSDDIPVSSSVLRFGSGPSKGNYHKRQPSKIPSKNRDELERISKLMGGGRGDGGAAGDDGDDDDEMDDDAALLRTAMADAKKKQKATKEASDTALALAKAGNTSVQYQYSSMTQVTEREKQYLQLVDESMTTILGMTTVRLFGLVLNVDKSHATVQVWRKGGTVFTEKRPVERLPLTHLQKLSKREFKLVCTKPLEKYTEERTKKVASGAITLEDMPATLMSHTNEIVESLIKKMETTAKIQKQAVADEMMQNGNNNNFNNNNNKKRDKNLDLINISSKSPVLSSPASSSPSSPVKPGGSRQSGFPGSSSTFLTSMNQIPSSSIGETNIHTPLKFSMNKNRNLSSSTPPPPTFSFSSSSSLNLAGSAKSNKNIQKRRKSTSPPSSTSGNSPHRPKIPHHNNKNNQEDKNEAYFNSVGTPSHNNNNHHQTSFGKNMSDQERHAFGKFNLAFSKDRHKLFRGNSLIARQFAASHGTLPPSSPLFDRYFNSSGTATCGVSVIRSLPEPPLTRLIDPLVDVREEFKALSVMNTSSTASWKPQSQYIQSIHLTNAMNSKQQSSTLASKNKDLPSVHDTSHMSFTSLIPILGGKENSNNNGNNNNNNNSNMLSMTPGGQTNNNKNHNNSIGASVGVTSTIKTHPLSPSFVESSLMKTTQSSSNSGAKLNTTGGHYQQIFSLVASSPSPMTKNLINNNATTTSTRPRSSSTKDKNANRVPQPVPPSLLYSSYSADAEALPTEISCTVLEYRPSTKCLLLNVRRIVLVAGGGGGPTNTSVGNNNNNNDKTNSPNSTARRPGSSAGVKRGASRKESGRASGGDLSGRGGEPVVGGSSELREKWDTAMAGLSTVLAKCAFVDIVEFEGAAENGGVEDETRSAPSTSFSSLQDAYYNPQPNTNKQKISSRSPKNNNIKNTNQQQQQQHSGATPPGSSSTSHGNRAGLGEVIVNCGHSFLQSLVGKTVDIIPLWSEYTSEGECVCICDILRGDLSILDEMISSKFATVSSQSVQEYENLRATFGQDQIQNPGSFRYQSARVNNNNNNINNTNHIPGLGNTMQLSFSGTDPNNETTQQMLTSQSSFGASYASGEFAPANENDETTENQHDKIAKKIASISQMKSGYFSAKTAHQVLERDPSLIINAAESFLGRRVFRLLEATKANSSNLAIGMLTESQQRKKQNPLSGSASFSSPNSSFVLNQTQLERPGSGNVPYYIRVNNNNNDDANDNNNNDIANAVPVSHTNSGELPTIRRKTLHPSKNAEGNDQQQPRQDRDDVEDEEEISRDSA